MSNRHYLMIEDKKSQRGVCRCQVLGNNDYFDEEFYQNLNITVDDNGTIVPTKVNYIDLLYEWDRWLDRHPEKRGIPQISEAIKECEDIDIVKENIFLHYASSESYEQQLFEISRQLFPFFCNWRGDIKSRYEMTLECY